MLNVLLILLPLSTFLIAPQIKGHPSGAEVPDTQFLWWLPDDTESVIVRKGPFVVRNDESAMTLKQALDVMSYSVLGEIQKGQPLKGLLGQTVLLAVEGARQFRSPRELGLMPYEGCTILVFDDRFAAARESFSHSLETHAKEIIQLGSSRVVVFEEKWERDVWRIYVTSLKPNILLIATDRDYLADVLNRMGRRANTRALPEELPEWKQVDTSAQFWAVRHYDKDGAKTDPTSPLSGLELAANNPDKQAIGLALSYRTQADELTIKYLSANPAAAKIAEESWKPESYALSPRIRAQEEGVIEILFSRRDLRDSILTLLVLASLGHAIFV